MRMLLRRPFVLCVLVAIHGIAATAFSQDAVAPQFSAEPPTVKLQWEIIAECQMIILPQKVAVPLLPDLSDEAKVEAAFATLQQMITRGEATLFATLIARGDGSKLYSESAEELRYPTEFDPPQLPANIPQDKGFEALKAWPIVGVTPTAYEVRKLGAIMEMEATASKDGKWIAANLNSQHVRLIRFSKYDAGVLASGERLSVEQPHFSSLKNVMTLQVRSGQRVLVGIHKVPAEENTMELFFLRIRTEKSGATP